MESLEATGVTIARDRGESASVAVKRQRRYSEEQKREILSAAAVPGTTQTEVSRRFGVCRGLIHYWRRQEVASVERAPVRFTPVVVSAEKSTVGHAGVGWGGVIEIELDGGVRLRVDGSVDEGALKRVLRALER